MWVSEKHDVESSVCRVRTAGEWPEAGQVPGHEAQAGPEAGRPARHGAHLAGDTEETHEERPSRMKAFSSCQLQLLAARTNVSIMRACLFPLNGAPVDGVHQSTSACNKVTVMSATSTRWVAGCFTGIQTQEHVMSQTRGHVRILARQWSRGSSSSRTSW